MSKRAKIIFAGLLSLGVVFVAAFLLLHGNNFAVLNPKGTIAEEQLNLIVITSLLSLIVVIPVFALTIYIVWKYRASNKKATYRPNQDGNKTAEAIWWLVPTVLIGILAVITWVSTHKLDPYKPIEGDKKALHVQVVALDWKWLFIYPEQGIATVNFLQVPEKTPITFDLTSDAPMNSFWIPQLGGQVYAMAGMKTKLHLMADKLGEYDGSSANISGEGFAGMRFKLKATSESDFITWVDTVKQSPLNLTAIEYEKLAEKSQNNPPTLYASYEPNLYDRVIMKYMTPGMQNAPLDESEYHMGTHKNGEAGHGH